jgi:hypothetical protein
MKKRLSIVAPVLLLGALASSQATQVSVQIDDTGVVIPAHQQRHVKNGHVLRWARVTNGGAWFVRFVNSPCANGVKEFGSDAGQPRTCVIAVRCATAGDASCTYHYTSALGPDQPPHDPDVIVDN